MSWPIVKLGDVMTIGRGSSPRPIKDDRFFTGGAIPWVKIADATASGKFIHKTNQHVNEYGASFSRKLKPGSLIFPASGTLGIPRFLGVEACIHDGWLYFSEYRGISPDWLYYRIILLKDYYEGIAYGAAIQNINTDIVRNTEIRLPDLATQQRISVVLCAYDDLIALNQRRITLLEDAARRLYREWFVHLRFPGHESVPVKDGVPKGWQSLTLGELCDSIDGAVVQTGPFGSQLHQHDYKDAGTPVVMPQDIVCDRIRMNKIARVDEQTAHRLARHRLKPFDIVFPRRGDITKRALVEPHQEGFICGTGCLKISLPPAPLHPLLLYFQLADPDMIKWIEGQAVGATMLNLSGAILRSVSCLIPDPASQSSFVAHAHDIRQQIDVLEMNNEQLALARDLLLPKLMSGQLDASGIRLPGEAAA